MAPQELSHHDTDGLESFLENHDTFIFDCDGVLWNGDTLLDSVLPALSVLRQKGKTLAFCTNNATLSLPGYQQKFQKLGVEVKEEELFTSAHASAHYLANHVVPHLPEGRKKIFVIGQTGLEEELRGFGLEWKGGSDPRLNELMPLQDFSSVEPHDDIGAVLYGFDMHVGYRKICHAFSILAAEDYKAKFILTNDDRTIPIANGCVCPGEGAIASTLLHARKDLAADTVVVGKPNKVLFDTIHARLGFDKSRACMVGDRLETDVMFGKNGGISTLWVLSGAGKKDDLDGWKSEHFPDYIAPGFGIFSALHQPN